MIGGSPWPRSSCPGTARRGPRFACRPLAGWKGHPRMHRSQPVDSFTIAYHETGPADAASVVLLHGWPGDSHDYRAVVPLLTNRYRVIVPDLRGFGASDRHLVDPDAYYS